MLSTQAPCPSTSRQADVEVEAGERLARDEVNLVSWRREFPGDLDARVVEWARRFPAHLDQVVTLPKYDLSYATRGLGDPLRSWLTADTAALISDNDFCRSAERPQGADARFGESAHARTLGAHVPSETHSHHFERVN